MTCDRVRDILCDALIQGAPAPLPPEVRAHLAQCPACRREHESLQSAAGALSAAVPPISRTQADRIARPARGALRSVRRRRVGLGLAAAAAGLLVGAALLLSNGSTPAAPDPDLPDWRFVLGDAGNSRRITAVTACAPRDVLWTHPVVGVPGAYKPLAWRDLVIVGTGPTRRTVRGGGRILAVDARTGERRWRRDFAAGDFYKSKGFPDRCILAGRLYVTDGSGCLVLDAASGATVRRLDPPRGAGSWGYLAAAGGRLYGVSVDGNSVFSVDADSGRCAWTRRAKGAFVPALAAEALYVQETSGLLTALDARTGRERWRAKAAASAERATVHARGGWVFVCSDADEVLAYRADTGACAWRRTVHGVFSSGLAVGDEAVYTVGGCVALALADGRLLWQPPGPINGDCSMPTVLGDRVLAMGGAEAGMLSVRDTSGRLAARIDGISGSACDGAIVSGGRIFVVGGGALVALPCGRAG